MTSFCYARDDEKEYRKVHKPVPGLYDGKKITTCAWCGKTLEMEECNEGNGSSTGFVDGGSDDLGDSGGSAGGL